MNKTLKPAATPLLETPSDASPTARLGGGLRTDSPAELPPRELPAYAPSKLMRLR